MMEVLILGNSNKSVKLTAAEVSYLWTTYLSDSMSICVFQYYLKHIDDQDIKKLILHALDLSQQHIEIIKSIFTEEKILIPQGFTKEDVNLNAERLFSDIFYLQYIKNMAKGGLMTYGRMLPNIYRDDIRSFYAKGITSSTELDTEATRILLEKGLATRPPTIPYPEKVEFVQKQFFVLERLGRRPALTGTEVTNLYANIQSNTLGSSSATGFIQASKTGKVRQYLQRGKEIAIKHIKVFRSYLENYSLPIPMSLDQEVTISTDPPFSEKLMMFHFSLKIYAGIGNFGVSISESQRSDLVMDYSRIMVEVLKYSEDGANIMINGLNNPHFLLIEMIWQKGKSLAMALIKGPLLFYFLFFI
ncbi:DUF3231 family protein [Mesobacillus maritimus]|uniref:DUF3231 family protein n=1 Tax=Mesobacillus maritimus TaxID=1643336 RepID=UPI00203CEF3D|nr:DUF3231 family protein [Mesobacillus maritimus]MCM3584205.1 DUF3231 family protein [Mesobacillus maritimus]MCM3669334.1 DUF3231 family protein [Mesobacillus maritimus]